MIQNIELSEKEAVDGLPFLRPRSYWAQRLGCHPITLKRKHDDGELEGVRIGDRVMHSAE
jgi:hypothetical protein